MMMMVIERKREKENLQSSFIGFSDPKIYLSIQFTLVFFLVNVLIYTLLGLWMMRIAFILISFVNDFCP